MTLLMLFFFLVTICGAQITNPHGAMTYCGPPARVDCSCPGIVAKVKAYEINICYKNSISYKDLRDCLKKVPSHCEVMAEAHNRPEWNEFVRQKGVLKMCGTQCHPQKCRCGDEPCIKRSETVMGKLEKNP